MAISQNGVYRRKSKKLPHFVFFPQRQRLSVFKCVSIRYEARPLLLNDVFARKKNNRRIKVGYSLFFAAAHFAPD